MGKKTWISEDDIVLREYYPSHTVKELSKILNRTENSVRNRCYVLGLNKKVKPIKDLTGETIGPLEILSIGEKTKGSSSTRWNCRCTLCGREFSVANYWLTHSDPYSHCICTKYRKVSGENSSSYRHGGCKSILYNRWNAMLTRTSNPNAWNYKHYGGRGIKVCEEWKDFKNFEKWCIEHGWNEHMSVDRIDNDLGYAPDNCRVIPLNEQQANRRPFNPHHTS